MSKLITAEQWDSFRWRVYNVFKSTILPIVLGMVLIELQEHGNFEGLFTKEIWVNIAYAVVVALVGSAIAGLDKVVRMRAI
jgi:hypothetical protein